MRIESGSYSLSAAVTQAGKGEAACTASLEVTGEGFTVVNPAVAFAAERFESFSVQVGKLVRGKVTRAQLLADDPTVFALTIEQSGADRTLQVRGHLAPRIPHGVDALLEFRFPVPRGVLAGLAESLKKEVRYPQV